MEKIKQKPEPFASYQKFVMVVLALLQFTIVLDFMIISPIGDILMKNLNITTSQFGIVVSSYAFSADYLVFNSNKTTCLNNQNIDINYNDSNIRKSIKRI